MAAKRGVDLVVSVVGLTLLSPLLALLVLAVRFDSPGPAFFGQKRIGRFGRAFTMWKLRSMHHGSSQELHHEASTRWFEERRSGERYKSERDPRITRMGRVLRRTSLDELPQLWNVLRGDMSLVGPRPVMAYERPRFEAWHLERELLRPGITGLWQVSGRDRLSALEMLSLDVQYVRRQSVWLDLSILALTLPTVLGDLRRREAQAPTARVSAVASPVAPERCSSSTTLR